MLNKHTCIAIIKMPSSCGLKNADPDQLASKEVNWSGSTFLKSTENYSCKEWSFHSLYYTAIRSLYRHMVCNVPVSRKANRDRNQLGCYVTVTQKLINTCWLLTVNMEKWCHNRGMWHLAVTITLSPSFILNSNRSILHPGDMHQR